MHDDQEGDHPRIRRIIHYSRGVRRIVSPIADAATDDAHGSNALDSDGSPADDGNPLFDIRGPFGEPVSIVNSGFNAFTYLDPPPHDAPDADSDAPDDRDDWCGDRERDNAENDPHSHRATR